MTVNATQRELNSIKEEIKSISSDISEIKTTLAVNTQSIVYHIKRTDMLEEDLKCSKKFQYMILGSITLVSVVVPIVVPLLFK